jgi:hypothetical protein
MARGESLGLQSVQRLAHRCAAHLVATGEVLLAQDGARWKAAAQNLLFEFLIDSLGV